MVDDGDAVGELIGLLQVLRRQHDGRAVGVQPADLLPQRDAAHRVEPGRGLVEEEHRRFVDE
jgi:hypothetical protein